MVKLTRLRPPQVAALKAHAERLGVKEIGSTTATFAQEEAATAARDLRIVMDNPIVSKKEREALGHVGRKLAAMAEAEREVAPVT